MIQEHHPEITQEKTAQASATRAALVIEAQRQDLVQAQVPQGDAAAYRSTKNDQASNVELVPWAQEKKDYVLDILRREKIDICCLQEIEIASDFPVVALSSRDYIFESETNDVKSRTGVYIRSNINYERRRDLEGSNNGIIIIDFQTHKQFRLVNLYRVFNPQNGRSPFVNFETQLQKINEAIINDQTRKIIIMGDFNLDDSKKFNVNYAQRNFFEILNEIFDNHGLQQLINFPTWERLVGNVIKQSVLDHIYVKDYTLITDINSIKPNIGDHLLVTFIIASTTPIPKFTQ